MFTSIKIKIAQIVVAPLIALLTLAGYNPAPAPMPTPTPSVNVQQSEAPSLGAYNPTGGGTYRLQTSIGTSNTSVRLSSFKEPISNIPYTMSYLNSTVGYGTLEPQNTSRSEFISFTGITQNSDGTAILTGVSRGLGRSYPYTASTTLAKAHSGQSIFIISDSPQHFSEYATKQNDEIVTGLWTFPAPVSGSNPATKDYVDGRAFGGIGNASETATGTVEIATNIEAASSTSSGTKGRLALPASLATSTYNSATAPLRVLVTANDGKLDSNFISTSTLFATTSIYSSPIGSVGKNIQVFSSTGTTTFSVPTGVTRIWVRLVGGGGGGGSSSGNTSCAAGGGGGSAGYAEKMVNVAGTSTIQVFVGSGGTAAVAGTWTTFGTNGFYFYSTGGGAGVTNGGGGSGGSTSGGDLNMAGDGGYAGGSGSASTLPYQPGAGKSPLSPYGNGGVGAVSCNAGTVHSASGATASQGLIIVTW